ncbi:TRAP transporter substrate-binding protein DctP [Salipiger sp. H15]|uniref:TRAP transporter substrate-binding protein DctP n=1 Tax=Alloyangia sp. H15 TaxID=3029062 RepID=A0AAU8ALH1_9RHOB
MHTRRKFLRVAAGAALATPFIATPGLARGRVLNLQTWSGANSTPFNVISAWAEALNERTNGDLRIRVSPGGSIVSASETFEAMRNGALDAHYSSLGYFATLDPAFIILGDPGPTYANPDQLGNWMNQGGGIELARELYDRFDIHFLRSIYYPSEQFVSKTPIHGISDLQGLKMRIPPGLMSVTFAKAGAATVNIPGGEAYNALQSGIVDAVDWSTPAVNMQTGLYTLAPYSIDARHSMAVIDLAFGKRTWNALGADLQGVLTEASAELDLQMKGALVSEDAAAISSLESGDEVEIITWSEDEIARLREMTQATQAEVATSDISQRILESLVSAA